MPLKIIQTIHVLDLHNYVSYERMIPIEVNLDSNFIIEKLSSYKKFKYRFLIEDLLFTSNLENKTDVIFVTCNSLTNANEVLINSNI